MVLTTIQSHKQCFDPIDAARDVRYETARLGKDQQFWLEQLHPTYNYSSTVLRDGCLEGLRQGEEWDDSEEDYDVESGSASVDRASEDDVTGHGARSSEYESCDDSVSFFQTSQTLERDCKAEIDA